MANWYLIHFTSSSIPVWTAWARKCVVQHNSKLSSKKKSEHASQWLSYASDYWAIISVSAQLEKEARKFCLQALNTDLFFFPLNLNIDCIINRVGIVSTQQASNQFHLKLWIFLPCLDAILSHLSLLLFLIWWAYMGTVNIWKRMHFLNCQSLWK